MAEISLSNRVIRMQESATLRMAKLSRELKAQGKSIIDLSLGEPDFRTPDHVCEAAKKAIDDGFHHYAPVAGTLELREAICQKFLRDNGLKYNPSQIVVSTGAKQSIANAVMALINPGDEVLLPAPYWVSYAAIAELCEANCKEIHATLEQDFKITPAQLEASITDRSRLLIFSSPCNPTGSVYSAVELKALAEVIAKHPNLCVICDEIYEYINFTEEAHCSLASFPEVYDQVITVNGLSKGFAMTGWRLGYIGAPEPLAKACEKIQGQFTSGTSAITMKAAVAALSGPLDPSMLMREEFKRRRDAVYAKLKNISGMNVNLPDGAFYFFPEVSSFYGKSAGGHLINHSEDLCMYLLHDAGVALVNGEAFGDSSCIRISYAAAYDQLMTACDKISISLQKLNS
jgi:aspartate aminotransferase